MDEQKLKDLIASLTHEDAPNPEHQDKLEQTLRLSLANPERRRQSIRRTTMFRRIRQLSAAAAAVILLIAGFTVLHQTATPVYGAIEALALYENVRSIHMKGVCTYDPSVRYPEQDSAEIAIEFWYDLEKGRVRTRQVGFGFGSYEYGYTVSEFVDNGYHTMRVNHGKQTVVFNKRKDSEFRRQLFIRRHKLAMLQKIYSDLDQVDGYVPVGQEEIGGEAYTIWEKTGSKKTQIWISPVSGDIARYKTWSSKQDGEWRMRYDMHTVERNLEISDDVFKITPPDDYTFVNTLATADEPELLSESSATVENENGTLTLTTHILFALADGCLILGWSSEESSSPGSQEALFMTLEPGGPLPKLPAEIYALNPTSLSHGDLGEHPGYHLAHSQKEGRFYEWSVYVADSGEPARRIDGVRLVTRSHAADNKRAGGSIRAGIEIASSEDFDLLVRGAMSEFSDDDTAADHITYDYVTQLTQQIRASREP